MPSEGKGSPIRTRLGKKEKRKGCLSNQNKINHQSSVMNKGVICDRVPGREEKENTWRPIISERGWELD